MAGTALLAFVTVFIAELGDKTQLLALGFGARHRLSIVVAGLALGYALSNLIAAAIGTLIGEALPTTSIGIVGGVVFCALAVVSLRQPAQRSDRERRIAGPVILAIAATIFLGELGDKTQIATATLASRGSAIPTWIGSTAGVISAGTLGAVVGRRLSTRVRPEIMRRASAGAFALAGVAMIVTSLG